MRINAFILNPYTIAFNMQELAAWVIETRSDISRVGDFIALLLETVMALEGSLIRHRQLLWHTKWEA